MHDRGLYRSAIPVLLIPSCINQWVITMAQNVFKTTDKGSEYPSRFGGLEIRYDIVEAVPGDPHATLDAFLNRFVKEDATPEERAEIVADYFNGYGLTYRLNGIAKRILNDEKNADKSVEEVLNIVAEKLASDRIGAVAKREGSGKVAKAKDEGKKEGALDLYRRLTATQRKNLRPVILSQGILTEEDLDAVDAE